jgi:hypothetical protein
VIKELLNFKRFHVDVKDIKRPLLSWEKHDSRFPIERLLARQIINIVSFQIEIEHIFSLAGILANLGKCRLQPENLEKLFSVSKNWLNNPRVGCKEASSFVEFIKREENFEEEVEEFEGERERGKIENCE